MSRVTESYLREHGPVLTEMLTLADELPLVHDPSALVIRQSESIGSQVVIGGSETSVQLHDADYMRRVEAYRARAETRMAGLGAVAAMHLITSEYFTEDRRDILGHFPTLAFVGNAHYTCRIYDLKDRGSELFVRITDTVLRGSGSDSAVSARNLQIAQSEGVMNSLLSIQEVSCANTDSSEMHVIHEVWLDSISVLDGAKLILEKLGLAQCYYGLFEIYIQEAIDATVGKQLAADLLNSIEGTSGYTELENLIDAIRSEARAAAEAAERVVDHELPAADTLETYRRILSIARS